MPKGKTGKTGKRVKHGSKRSTRRTHMSLNPKSGDSKGINNQKKSHLVKIFLEMLNVVKLYHWKTRSFSQHKATDELYSRLNDHIDTFVEVLLGKDQSRINMIEKNIELLDASSTKEFQKRVFEYRGFLTDLDRYFDQKRDTDLLNIRDEILADINQFLYLLTFDK
jgi:DNA-binding ferritin-like protein